MMLIALLVFGVGFIVLDKILSSLFKKENALTDFIDGIIEKITGKSIVLRLLIIFGGIGGSLYLANQFPLNSIVAWMFAGIGFSLFGYIASTFIKEHLMTSPPSFGAVMLLLIGVGFWIWGDGFNSYNGFLVFLGWVFIISAVFVYRRGKGVEV